MSIKLRLALLLGSLLLGLLVALAWLRYLERAERESLLANERETRAQLLNRWIDFTGRTLPQLAADTALSDEALQLLSQPDTELRRKKIEVFLQLEHEPRAIERAIQADWRQAQVFLAFGLMLIAAVALALQAWVLRPLGRIGRSLATNDPNAARELEGEKNELGGIARLVLSSFTQREILQHEVAERARAQSALEHSEAALRDHLEVRARLGRDLHDGVIQSLYAAGMGLAGVRAALRPDQVEAMERLDQTRATLNETIRDVRNFIGGLEPEALKLQSFSQAVAALLEIMRGIRPFRSTVEIDDALAAALTLGQRVHALQITREAVSNALRHGAASHIHVALRLREGFAEVAVNDDGHGFDSSKPPPPGHGLGNFAERASELGANLTVQSAPGRGTTVKLVFPHPLHERTATIPPPHSSGR